MKRMGSFLLLLCLLLSFLVLPVSADTTEQRVFDQAALFTTEQCTALETQIQDFRQETGMDFVVVTTENVEGKSTREYADDFYDQNSFGLGEDRSGVLFLIDMENRLPHISTTGMAIRYFTDSRLNAILDSCYDDLSNGDYAGAASVVIQQSLQYYQSDIPEDQYNYDTETGEISVYEEPVPHFPNCKVILIFVLISFAVGLIFCGSVCGKYRMHLFEYKYPFRQKSNFSLSQKEDVFLHKNVSKTRIANDPPSNGSRSSGGGSRSSTHSSSSGTTHGGATGKRF